MRKAFMIAATCAATFAAALSITAPANAQAMPSTCHAMARIDGPRNDGPRIEKASLQLAQLQADEVKITYVGHSAFRIETPAGISIVTDFNGAAGPGGVPTAVTMNHAHGTHFTLSPDPAIKIAWKRGVHPCDSGLLRRLSGLRANRDRTSR